MDTQKKKRGILPKILILVLILLVLILCGTLLTGGYLYLNNKSSWNWDILFGRSSNNSDQPSIDNLTSKTIYNPTGEVINIVEKSSPAVVTVLVKSPPSAQLQATQDLNSRRTLGSGTGFFITEDGILITNQHVVCGADANQLFIVTADDKKYSVDAVAVDSAQDVAILKVNTNGQKVSRLVFSSPESKIKVGQDVIAIGNPFGDNPGSVTKGIVSGVNRNITATGRCEGDVSQKDYEAVIQTDAAINSGNSGGPLLNMNGEVIGVNSATLTGANNISYTVPFNTVLRVLDRYYKNNNKIISPYFGVTHKMLTPETVENGTPVGAEVVSVQPGSPAEKAGIKAGDVITKIGDKDIDFSLIATLNQYFEPGQKTTVEIYRSSIVDEANKTKTLTLSIEVGTRPSDLE
jgi:S1-C subfamily serine protease